MINSDYYLANILRNLLILKEEVARRNKLGYTDLNKSLENFFCKILNIVFDYELINVNKKQGNFPGIDLGDLKNSISFQITSQNTSRKVNHTLQEYIDERYYEKYSLLRIFIIGTKQKNYSINIDTSFFFKFDSQNDIIDYDDLLRLINNLDLKKKFEINEIVQNELPYGKVIPTYNPLSNVFIETSKFVGREKELDVLKNAILNQDSKLIIVDGLAGIGKSALVSKFVTDKSLCPYSIEQILMIDCKEYQNITDIYRRFSEWFDYNFENEKTEFSKILKNFPKDATPAQYSDISRTIISNLDNCLLIFDNFEGLLYNEKVWDEDEILVEKDILEITDKRIDSFFELLIDYQHNAKVIITSRYTPKIKGNQKFCNYIFKNKLKGLDEYSIREYANILSSYAFTLKDWELIHEIINGHPTAFQFLCQLLEEPENSVESLLKPISVTKATSFQVYVARELLIKLINQLTSLERNILTVVCVFRKSFSSETIQYLMNSYYNSTADLFLPIKTLEKRCLLEKIKENEWTVHNIVKAYLKYQNRNNIEDLYFAAADYYDVNSPEEFLKLSDISWLTEAYYFYDQANMSMECLGISYLLSEVLHKIGYTSYINGIKDESTRNENWEEAEHAFKLILEHEVDNWRPYFYYANIQRKQQKESNEVIPHFEKAIELVDNVDENKKRIYGAYASYLFEQQDYNNAINKIEKYLTLNPSFSEKLITSKFLALCLEANGDYLKVVNIYKQVLQQTDDAREKMRIFHLYDNNIRNAASLNIFRNINDTSVELSFTAQINAIKNKSNSIEYLYKAHIYDPDNVFILFNLGKALAEYGKYEEAIDVLTKAKYLEPNGVLILRSIAFCLKSLKKYPETTSLLEDILKLYPRCVSVIRLYGDCLFEQNLFDEALAKYLMAYDISSKTDFVSMQGYAKCLVQLKEYENADNVFSKMKIDNLDNVAKTEWARLKISIAKRNNDIIKKNLFYNDARTILESIISKDEYVYKELAYLEGLLGNEDIKEKTLLEANKLFPYKNILLQELADYYSLKTSKTNNMSERNKYFSLAKRYYDRIIEIDAADYILYRKYALFLSNNRIYEEADNYFRFSLELVDNDSETHSLYGNMLRFRNTRQEEAEHHLKRAIELQEDNYYAHLYYACYLYMSERFQESEKHYMLALKYVHDGGKNFIEKEYNKEKGRFKRKHPF